MKQNLRTLWLAAALMSSAFANAASFTNSTSINLPTGPSGTSPGSPYPSSISVAGLSGTITKVTVTLNNINHDRPDDLEILLVGPTGKKFVLLADAGGTGTPAVGINLTFDDAAAAFVADSGPLATGSFKPTCVDAQANIQTEFATPAPAGPYDVPGPSGAGTLALTFDGTVPNGTWSLYVVDDIPSTPGGSISSGWTLNITTGVTTEPSVTTVTSSQNPSFTGNSVTFTASVKRTNNAAITSGGVIFKEGASVLQASNAVNGSGQVTFITSALTEGIHVITAEYTGNASFFGSSVTITQVVDTATTISGNTFANRGAITVGDTASVYPSHLFVTNLSGSISKVTMTVSNITYARPDDIELLLVAPNGAHFIVLADAGGTASGIANVTLMFDDAAGSLISDTVAPGTGTFRPTDYNSTAAVFPAPAPAGPYNHPAPAGGSTFANVFDGLNPNGTWSLYVVDDVPGGGGTIAGGWALTFTTTGDAPTMTTIISSLNPSFTNQFITFTAAVKRVSDSAVVTNGTVTFREGTNILPTVALNTNGIATFLAAITTEGDHVISADYNGAPGSFNVSSRSMTQRVDNPTIVSGTRFANPGPITIPTDGVVPMAYPSRINVTNLALNYCRISVTLSNISIDRPDDLELLLVSPTGAQMILMGDVGGTATPANNVTLTFSDSAAAGIPDPGPLTTGTYKPTSVNSSPANFPAPAPAPPYNHPASFGTNTLGGVFTNNPNGYWNLYVMDDVPGGASANIANGWALTFTYPQAATVGGPQSICAGGTTAGLGGNTPTGTGAWSIIGGGTGTFNPSATTPNATFTHTGGSGPITNRWTLTDPSCGSSSADVVVTILPSPAVPTIVANPTNVCASSTGNLASSPAATTYAWTIGNGTITSATNLQTITYTAGASGNVTLTLKVSNASGCTTTSSTNVPISGFPGAPAIVLNPTTVNAGYPGNQATAPVAASYAWTIANGTITGPANQQTVTYVAGASGSVTVGLIVFNAGGCSASNFAIVPITPAPPLPVACSFQTNYFASITFTDRSLSVAVSMAFDGSNYWSCSGNDSSGLRLARYDATGAFITNYAPGLDFRSVFTDGSGAVLARAYSDRTIYRQVAPGVFTNSGVALTGGPLDPNGSVVFNGAGTEYIAMSNGVVSRWNLVGAYIGSVTLQGFGSVSGETATYQNVRLASVGNYWLTYNANRTLSMWDVAGNRVWTATLFGAGSGTIEAQLTLSYCNGKVFIADTSGGLWRGYDVCGGGARVAIFGAPSGGAAWNADVQAKILGVGSIAQVDAFLISSGNPVPTLADLRKYQAVLVYSDAFFNNATNIGNVLADYVDQGGGVVVATFAFAAGGAGYAMQGRFVTGGYSAYATGAVATASGLTLVKDLPTHALLDSVASFNGGGASYRIAPLALNGSTLVAHWSNGDPLIATKDVGPGRVVGLNFYPPSSNAISTGWLTNTDGARLMANALLYAGKEPPTILSGPSNLVVFAGAAVNFNVAAVGSATLTYQWRKNGVNLSGATANNFNFTATPAGAGQYSIVVSNSYGAAYSSNALVTVISSTNLTLNATDTGWYDSTGFHDSGNPNYVAGNQGGNYWRNWFVFNIPPLSGPLVGAQLRVNTYDIVSPTGSETYQLHQVTTPVATLTAGGSGLTSIYNDLGDGPIYAARTFAPGESTRFITVPLNQTLRTAVAGAAGGSFAMGGEITTLDPDDNNSEYIFGVSFGNPGDVQLVLTVGTGDLPIVGYFTDNNPSSIGPLGPITNAAFAPLLIGNIATQNFAGLRILFIDESANDVPSSPLLARLPEIKNWVSAGGRLIVHDRGAGLATPNPFLIGTPGLGTVRSFEDDLDLVAPATTLVTAGPFGVINNSTLDGGCDSAHGFILASNLPARSRALLSVGGDSNQIVAFSYPLGAGFVYYSCIPLDYYLDGGDCGSGITTNLQFIYTPNVLTYMHTINPPLKFLPPAVGAANALPLFLGNADNTGIALDRSAQIHVYSATNVALALSNWNLLPNPLTLTNGLLRIDGLRATNPPPTFFRAVETP